MMNEWMNDGNGFIDSMGSFTHYIRNELIHSLYSGQMIGNDR